MALLVDQPHGASFLLVAFGTAAIFTTFLDGAGIGTPSAIARRVLRPRVVRRGDRGGGDAAVVAEGGDREAHRLLVGPVPVMGLLDVADDAPVRYSSMSDHRRLRSPAIRVCRLLVRLTTTVVVKRICGASA